jgi:tRNA-specific 2-thiouridylase
VSVGVGFSGGADSLLALCLLQEQGYEPHAVHASFLEKSAWEEELQHKLTRICRRLNVPLHCVNMEQVFAQEVINPFVQAYAQGLTPNPCAWCNRRIKFRALAEEIQSLGIQHIATGHYAQVRWDCYHPPGLFRGMDAGKDQSYFLALVDQGILQNTLFPLATWTKEAVHRALARRGLGPVQSRESQEICFVSGNDYREFLAAQDVALPGPGDIVDTGGKVLGRHQGLHRHTLGQRRGLGIAHSEPLYVVDKDQGANHLIVGPRSQLRADTCRVRLVNSWVESAVWPEEVWVQTNYRQAARSARIRLQDPELDIHFEQPCVPPTPGQIAVLYSRHGRVLGGGEILRPNA